MDHGDRRGRIRDHVLGYVCDDPGTRHAAAATEDQCPRRLGELLRNRPWVVLLIASVLSTTFIALQAGSTAFYFKYVVGGDRTPIFLGLDRTTIFLSTGMLAQVVGTVVLGFLARRVDKKYAAAGLCAVTGVCFMTFYFLPKDRFDLFLVVECDRIPLHGANLGAHLGALRRRRRLWRTEIWTPIHRAGFLSLAVRD